MSYGENGSVVGPQNLPTSSAASGVWSLGEVAEAQAVAQTAAEAEATKAATDAAAGKAKLKELGLTDDQIAALVG